MSSETPLFVPPTAAQRVMRKTAEVVLARLPIGGAFAALPFFRKAYTARLLARRDHTGLHSGIYGSYQEALAHIPEARLAGWDHEAAAQLWVDKIDPVRLSTYPVFFWLQRLLQGDASVLDVGGSIGSTYYGYRRYASLRGIAAWTVVEVPKICRQGEVIARREGATELRFLSDRSQAPPCDLLLAAGALQYMQDAVPGLIEALPTKPRYLLLNKLPLTQQKGCWTLQNYGPAVTPQQLFNEGEFLAYFHRQGYRPRDRWVVDDLDCLIPFHPEHFIKHFSGFLFELEP
jgi:putative methyltransferase (TIGR04325 family)